MNTTPITPASRIGTPGLDVFKIAGTSISGFLHSWKTGDSRQPRQPFTSLLEERLAVYLEYHPQVRTYQRGDASAAFVSAYRLATPLETPYRIPYLYEGQLHHYLPDFVGTLSDGSLLIAEAGLEREKRQGVALAKAEAARHLAQAKGGVYWIGTEQHLSLRRHHNLLYLHARRQPFATEQDILAALLADWPWGNFRCVEDSVRRFGSRWSEAEVEAALWKVVAEAAATGRLLVDLNEVELQRDTPLALLSPDDPPLLPDPLPSSLEVGEPTGDAPAATAGAEAALPMEDQGVIPGPTIDGSAIQPEAKRQRFYRNLAAATEVLKGGTLAEVAQKYAMSVAWLWQLVERVKTHGQLACVPHGTYQRERALRPEFQQLIRLLYTQRKRPTVMEVFEDVRLKRLAEDLSQREGTLVLTPTYRQVGSFLQSIDAERSVVQARSGLKHRPHERLSPSSFVRSIPSPALLCQVDEHTLDLRIVTQEGTVVTRRVHAAVLICVKTAAILGAVLALDSLKEEDYMRLLKQALEPKDRLVSLYECQHRWPCFGKPAVIFHDRGKIFTSERARQVVVDRLGIVTEQAPLYCPTANELISYCTPSA